MLERNLNPGQLLVLPLSKCIWGTCGQDLGLRCQTASFNTCRMMAQVWANLLEDLPSWRDRGLYEP